MTRSRDYRVYNGSHRAARASEFVRLVPEGVVMPKGLAGIIALTMAASGAVESIAAPQILYNNGGINGTIGGLDIGSYATSDSFTLSNAATITGVDFGVWTVAPGIPETVNWAIVSTPNTYASGTQAAVSLISTFCTACGTNNYYDIYWAAFSVAPTTLAAGTYYLVLTGVVTTLPGVSSYWDINDGPSSASVGYYNSPLPSEAFQVISTTGVPEVSTWSMMLLGFSGLGFATYRRAASKRAPAI